MRILPTLAIKEVVDIFSRDNFKKLQDFFNTSTGLDLFQPVEFQVNQSLTEYKIKHGLGFVPRDVLVTQLIAGSGVKLTVHHGLSTKDELVVSSSGPLKARLLVGSFRNVVEANAGTFTTNSTDKQEFKAIQ